MNIDLYEMHVEYRLATYIHTDIICIYMYIYIYMNIDVYETRIEYRFSTCIHANIICIHMYIYIYECRSNAYIQIPIYYVRMYRFATTVYTDSLFTYVYMYIHIHFIRI